MSGKIVQLNEAVIKSELKELVRGSVERSITFYNEKRPHSSIHYKTPNAAEEAFYHNENG